MSVYGDYDFMKTCFLKKIYYLHNIMSILLKEGDDKYVVVANPDHKDGTAAKYLVGTTGNVVKTVNKYKDANDMYFIIGKDGEIYKTYDEDAAKAAVKGNYTNVTVAQPTK